MLRSRNRSRRSACTTLPPSAQVSCGTLRRRAPAPHHSSAPKLSWHLVTMRHVATTAALGALVLLAGAGVWAANQAPKAPASSSGAPNPLALTRGGTTGDVFAIAGSGTVRITDHCVTLGGDTLAWSQHEARWDPLHQAVIFDHAFEASARTRTIRDGDAVSVGGLNLSLGQGQEGKDAREDRRNIRWAKPPHPSCPEGIILVDAILPQRTLPDAGLLGPPVPVHPDDPSYTPQP